MMKYLKNTAVKPAYRTGRLCVGRIIPFTPIVILSGAQRNEEPPCTKTGVSTRGFLAALGMTIIIYLLFNINSIVSGQDIHFSQFYQTPLIINPALTGVFNGDIRVLTNHKSQWKSIGAPYKTYALSYDMALLKKKWESNYLGAGFLVFNDRAGKSKFGITQFNLSLSGIVSLDKNHSISAGLQGGFAQRSINYSDLKWGNQFDGTNYNSGIAHGETFEPFAFGDFSAGLSWSYGKGETNIAAQDQFRANAGVALFHINKPKQEFYLNERLYSKLVLHGGTYIDLKYSKVALLPSILFLKQGPLKEINLGGMVRYTIKEESRYTGWIKETAFLIGGYYRTGDAFIPSFMFEFANFALGISYDVNISGLRVASGARGGVEISLRYINPNPFSYGKGTKGTPML